MEQGGSEAILTNLLFYKLFYKIFLFILCKSAKVKGPDQEKIYCNTRNCTIVLIIMSLLSLQHIPKSSKTCVQKTTNGFCSLNIFMYTGCVINYTSNLNGIHGICNNNDPWWVYWLILTKLPW